MINDFSKWHSQSSNVEFVQSHLVRSICIGHFSHVRLIEYEKYFLLDDIMTIILENFIETLDKLINSSDTESELDLLESEIGRASCRERV